MPVLLAGRAVQGLGGGLLAGLGYVMLQRALPERLWARGAALVSAMWGIGNILGPLVGGLFAQFGKVENTLMLKDKRVRVEGKKGKVTFATGVVVFASIVSAHAAVIDGEQSIKQADGDWALVESVAWASGQKPDLDTSTPAHEQAESTAAPKDSAPKPSTQPTEPSKPSFSFPGLNSAPKGGKPSFGSFASAAASGAPKASSFNPAANASSAPSLEEMTLMRLKNAQREKERKALEEQLAKEDEAADAEEAAAKPNGK